ncbi:MAG: hypothetical protein VX916_03355 [Planctomycetota bacterium]|nr:hypothetical protein [Planctomycetota bacterium]
MSKTRRETTLKKRKEEEAAELKKLQSDQRWRNRKKIDSRYFDVESNLPEDQLDEWVDALETYYKYFREFWGITISPKLAKKKMKVFLYRNSKDFHDQTEVAQNIGGFFNWGVGELHIPFDDADPAKAKAVLFHEFNHLLTYLIEPDFMYPIWLNEGMAEYYGTAYIDEKGDFIVGGQQDGRLVSITKHKKEGKLWSIPQVLLTERGTFNATHYAYAWSFCHFLMQSEKYSKGFRAFFGNLHNNRDIPQSDVIYDYGRPTKKMVALSDVIPALEKRVGASIEELEAEWRHWIDQAYGDLNPRAYYLAARIELMSPKEDGSHVTNAIEFYEKAIELGVNSANCYRDYAEVLRRGGMDTADGFAAVIDPDIERAWGLIQEAIKIDPINPILYLEAAGIRIAESPLLDPDQAIANAETAKALDPKNPSIQELYQQIMTKVEEGRDTLRRNAEEAARLAAHDPRVWHWQAFFYEGEEPSEVVQMSTSELKELISAGVVQTKDWIYQAYRPEDPQTGELLEGTEPWELGWIAIEECPVFADDLQASGEEAGV